MIVTFADFTVGFVPPVPVAALGGAGVAVVVVPPDALPAVDGLSPSATDVAPPGALPDDIVEAPTTGVPSLVPRSPDSTVPAVTALPATTACVS